MRRLNILRISSSVYFGVVGIVGAFFLTFGSPIFWYTVCGYYFALCAILWAWRPRIAAGLSVGPILGLSCAFRYSGATVYSLYVAAVLAPAVIFTLIALPRPYARNFRPILISLVAVGLTVAADTLYISRTVVRTYEMKWAVEGQAPWDIEPQRESHQASVVVLYRKVGDGYCYDVMPSPELLRLLQASGKKSVLVQYNTSTFFGRPYGYNIRSVGGLMFNDGQRDLRPGEEGGSGVAAFPVNGKAQSPSCW